MKSSKEGLEDNVENGGNTHTHTHKRKQSRKRER